MIALRFARHVITGEPIDRDTRRAAARRAPIGYWDQGTVVGAFRDGRGTFHADQPQDRAPLPRRAGERR